MFRNMPFAQKNLFFVFALCSLFFNLVTSCKPAPNTKADFLQWAKKEEIIKVICKDDQTLSYNLYLPSNYKAEQLFPIVYCFDPHGDGNLPVSLIKTYAEKNGIILIGSNNSKNGISAQDLQHIVDVLLTDTKTKLAINSKQIYALGFSGGARVACSMALTYPDIAGVIACSAGYKPSSGQNLFDIIGIAGKRDMNYLEMRRMNTELANYPINHLFYSFDDTHKWPPVALLEKALDNFKIFGMRKGNIALNNAFIKESLTKSTEEIQKYTSSKNPDSLLTALELIQNAEITFSQLIDIETINYCKKTLIENPLFTKAKENEEQLLASENERQQVFSKAISAQSMGWWKDEISKLKKESKVNSMEGVVSSRLLAFVSLMSYSYINSAIQQQNWTATEHFLQIYGLADPENPDYYYFKALYEAQMNHNELAVKAIESAIKYGFKDLNKLNNPVFQNMKLLPSFEKLKNEMTKK